MKIGVDVRPLISGKLTGVGTYTFEVLKHLLEIDQSNQYKFFYNSVKIPNLSIIEEFKKFSNVEISGFRYPSKLFNLLITFFNWPRLDKFISGCDVFWFPNLNFWSVSDRCKTIVTVHDLSFEKLSWAYSNKMKFWHKVVRPDKKLKLADKIIAVSESTKNDLVDVYGIKKDKIEVVYSGTNLKQTTNNKQQTIQNYNLPEKFILYLGTLEPRKNVEGIISAFEQISDSSYSLVIGGGQGWLYKKIFSKARQSPAKERIKFINYVTPAERASLYQLADIFIWPSFYEGFGFPPLEAMASGCPVITSANSSLPEVVGSAAVLVDPYNIQEIKMAINHVISDKRWRESLINKGYEQIKKFNWRQTAEDLLKVFNSL